MNVETFIEEAYNSLQACPFCGIKEARPVVMGEYLRNNVNMVDWGVECDCGCLLQSFEDVWDIETAVKHWNKRVNNV